MKGFEQRPKQLQKNSMLHTQALYNRLLELPALGICELIETFCEDNPYLETKKANREISLNYTKKISRSDPSSWDIAHSESLYDLLLSQIIPPLFPTPRSQKIARYVIENLNEEGYFCGDSHEIASLVSTNIEIVEQVRQRFAYLEPAGIGAKDYKEAMLFSLNNFTLDYELEELLYCIIRNLEHLERYIGHERYSEAKMVLKKLRTPPALEFMPMSQVIIPDVIVEFEQGEMNIMLNKDDLPLMSVIDEEGNHTIREKVKQAKNFISLLDMRSSTLMKVAIEVIKEQYRYFLGGPLIPLTMEMIADKVGFSQSTISRTLAGKSLMCDRGIIFFRDLFTNSLGEQVSKKSVQEFIVHTIESESHENPYSDQMLTKKIEDKFGIVLTRRAITKYRLSLGLMAANERKRLYQL